VAASYCARGTALRWIDHDDEAGKTLKHDHGGLATAAETASRLNERLLLHQPLGG
jgi:hypothetical protein